MKKLKFLSLLVLGLLVFAGCENNETQNDLPEENSELMNKFVEVDVTTSSNSGRSLESIEDRVKQINEDLVPYGVQIEKMEYLMNNDMGNIVFFSDRGNKQLSSDYVPFDPRNGNGADVPYIIDGTQITTSSGLDTFAPTVSAMSTWDAVTCSDGLNIPFLGVAPFDVGFVSNIFGFGGTSGFFPGIIVHAGVLPSSFFDAIAPGGGSGILGVTFTLSYIEDINEDGVGDVAVKEIYYNDAFNWQDTVATGAGVDYETVCLHEVGHALSQAHFGKVSGTFANGKIHFSPRALMNAGYTGVNRVVEKTDKAGHCSNWGNWPNN